MLTGQVLGSGFLRDVHGLGAWGSWGNNNSNEHMQERSIIHRSVSEEGETTWIVQNSEGRCGAMSEGTETGVAENQKEMLL